MYIDCELTIQKLRACVYVRAYKTEETETKDRRKKRLSTNCREKAKKEQKKITYKYTVHTERKQNNVRKK